MKSIRLGAASMVIITLALMLSGYPLEHAVVCSFVAACFICIIKGPVLGVLLLMSCRAGSVGLSKFLIAFGAGVDSRGVSGCTPLMLVVKKGQKEMVEKLLDAGADIGCVDGKGNTALSLAIDSGNKTMVGALIPEYRKGVDTAVLRNEISQSVKDRRSVYRTQRWRAARMCFIRCVACCYLAVSVFAFLDFLAGYWPELSPFVLHPDGLWKDLCNLVIIVVGAIVALALFIAKSSSTWRTFCILIFFALCVNFGIFNVFVICNFFGGLILALSFCLVKKGDAPSVMDLLPLT